MVAVRHAGIAGLVLATVAGASAHAQNAQVVMTPSDKAPLLTLTVTDTAEAAPDLAIVSVGVNSNAPTASAAMADASTKMTGVIAAIRAQKVDTADIRTSSVGVSPRYEYRNNRNQFMGYVATNTVVVILRSIARTGPFLDAMTAAGATEINGPTFAIDKPEMLRVKARDSAVAKAAQEAQAYAKRTGHARASLLSIVEGGGYAQPVDIVVTGGSGGVPAAVMAPPPPPVLGGRQSIGVSLTMVYRLED